MRPKERFKAFNGYGCVPRKMHPAWQRVTYLARALGRDLMSLVDDFETMRIPTSGEWQSSLCMSLCVNGRNDRRSARLALESLVDAGLLTIGEGFVTVNLEPVSVRSACVSGAPVESVPCVSGAPVESVPCVSGVFNQTQVPENTQVASDSKLVSKEVSERARAPAHAHTRDVGEDRAELIGFRFVASLLGRSSFDISPVGAYTRQYAWIGSKPPPELETVRRAVEADGWCLLNPHKVDAPHLERRWQHYLHGDAKPVLKPVIAPKPEPRGIWAKAAAT